MGSLRDALVKRGLVTPQAAEHAEQASRAREAAAVAQAQRRFNAQPPARIIVPRTTNATTPKHATNEST